jgi:EAL domain-containing protein (putative c-di-GMP-specific phosphodiesterase class I)
MLLHYQPILRVEDRRLAGFEALMRWKHPDRGLLVAEQFVALAEETGAITALDIFALRTAAQDLSRWLQIVPEDALLFVNVNLSARHLTDENFIVACETAGAAHGLPRGTLRLEITETLEIDEGGAAERSLMRLRRAGYTLVMDDFGAGHSTPRRLAHLPFDAVKIDRSFLAGGTTTRSVLAGLLRLAHDLGLEATTEGVESEEDMAFLAERQCGYAQGFACGTPADETATRAQILLAYGASADAEVGE